MLAGRRGGCVEGDRAGNTRSSTRLLAGCPGALQHTQFVCSDPACWERLDLGNELHAERMWGLLLPLGKGCPVGDTWVTPG